MGFPRSLQHLCQRPRSWAKGDRAQLPEAFSSLEEVLRARNALAGKASICVDCTRGSSVSTGPGQLWRNKAALCPQRTCSFVGRVASPEPGWGWGSSTS